MSIVAKIAARERPLRFVRIVKIQASCAGFLFVGQDLSDPNACCDGFLPSCVKPRQDDSCDTKCLTIGGGGPQYKLRRGAVHGKGRRWGSTASQSPSATDYIAAARDMSEGEHMAPEGESLPTFDIEQLSAAVTGDAAFLRWRTRLQPAAGAGAKVHPPTYAPTQGARQATARYHLEQRVDPVTNEPVTAVVLDSVPSQANRAELALLDAYDAGSVVFPFVEADFGDAYSGVRPGRLTALEASHRAADAVFAACTHPREGVLFRESTPGKAIVASTPRDAADMFRFCPHVLCFGEWDTHDDAVRGHKFERAVVSEVVAIDATVGRASASKLDPLRIEGAELYENAAHRDDPTEHPAWTADPEQASKDSKGRPVLHGSGEHRGKPSAAGLSSVTPRVAAGADGDETGIGGITCAYAEQTTVVSLGVLRRLRFPRHGEAANAARTALAALAVAASVLRDAEGYSYRSGCWLVAEAVPLLEAVTAHNVVQPFAPLRADAAVELVNQAAVVGC